MSRGREGWGGEESVSHQDPDLEQEPGNQVGGQTVTPGQKFGTEERDNPVGFGILQSVSVFCLPLGTQCLLFMRLRICFLLTAHSPAHFTCCTPDGRIVWKLLGPIHTHPRTAPASAFQDPHLLMGSQLPSSLCHMLAPASSLSCHTIPSCPLTSLH